MDGPNRHREPHAVGRRDLAAAPTLASAEWPCAATSMVFAAVMVSSRR